MPYWERFTILAVVVGLAILLAKFVDSQIKRLNLTAANETRYRVLRRGLVVGIIFIALLAGLTVIPQVRSVAGAILASSALIAIIVGFASQRVLGNFVAGLMIAVTQPLRLGDRVVFEGQEGVVEEINLTYTFLRADDDSRVVIPNEKLASDTIVNATIVSRMQRAEITLHVPLSTDLETVINLLRDECSPERETEVFVSSLDGDATITVRALARRSGRGRDARARPAAARAALPAHGRGLRVTASRPPDDLGFGRRRRSRTRGRRHGRRNAVAVVLIVLFGVPIVLGAAGLGATAAFKNSCSLDSLQPVTIGQNSFVYAADGSLLGSIPAEHNRQPVPLNEISPWMAKAVIATEDRRFYQHGGVDWEGIIRAAWRDAQKGKVVEGGSTITQQLVRNLYISRERTFQRKVKEVCLAFKLSKQWSKDRILAAWMNQVYFGNHAYGVEAAAQTYFSKHAKDLTLMQAAVLAGLPQAPSLYDPILYPQAALARRANVSRGALHDRRDLVRPLPVRAPRHEPPPEARAALLADPRAVLLQLRPRPADRDLRRPDRPVRRPARLHDDQPCVPARAPRRRSRTRST